MPKGTPNPQPTGEAPRKLTLIIQAADYAALQELADEQYRTPELQAAYLIAKILRDAGRNASPNGVAGGAPAPVAHAQRILDRARVRTTSDES